MIDLLTTVMQAEAAVDKAATLAELDDVRVHYLGKKGVMTALLKTLGAMAEAERPAAGQEINSAKQQVSTLLNARRELLESVRLVDELGVPPFVDFKAFVEAAN